MHEPEMAWEELDKNGFIKTITGSGTFVNELTDTEIQKKQDTKAKEIAQDTCNKAKQNGISKQIIIDLINELY